MAACRLDHRFYEHAAVKGICRRFGLVGYARLLKVIEECTDSGMVSMRLSDWLETLDCTPDEFHAFAAVLVDCKAFSVSQGEDVGSPVLLTIGPALSFLMAPPPPETVIYTDPEQWSHWCAFELATPAHRLKEKHALSLFRRWCASNVSLAEMSQAAIQAAALNDLSPIGLHAQLTQIRAQRLEQARNPGA